MACTCKLVLIKAAYTQVYSLALKKKKEKSLEFQNVINSSNTCSIYMNLKSVNWLNKEPTNPT